jgi:corrinoid protein of di/trimethylamine methyltransferase
MAELSKLKESIAKGNLPEAMEAVKTAIADNEAVQDIMNSMMAAMEDVGLRFEQGKAFVPELLMAGRAMKGVLEHVKPLLVDGKTSMRGKVVIGTVKGDLHDIGKNLVSSMLEGSGFEIVDLGIDVSTDKFLLALREHSPDILCMSALLTTTMTYMKDVVEAVKNAGLRDKVKILVGGAPVSQSFSDQIGADGYGENANSAATLAKALVAEARCA